MLDHSGALGIGDDEWLTIAARGIQDQPRLGPPDNDAQTVMMRLRGVDLAAFRAEPDFARRSHQAHGSASVLRIRGMLTQ